MACKKENAAKATQATRSKSDVAETPESATITSTARIRVTPELRFWMEFN